MTPTSQKQERLSGQQWPQHRLKWVSTINDAALSETTDPDWELEYIDIGNVTSKGEVLSTTRHSFEKAPSRARRIVADGDVIISTVRTYLKAVARLENPPENLIVSTGFAVVRPRKDRLLGRFAFYALQAEGFIGQVVVQSLGISYPAITSERLSVIPVCVPDKATQEKIAAYLDNETARIDELLAEKEMMLRLLEVKRTALVSRVVTQGIDPKAKMKPSGVEWLPEIPAHWKVIRLKHVSLDLQTGPFGSQLHANDYVEDGTPLVNPADMSEGKIKDDPAAKVDRETLDRLSRHILHTGDLLFARRGKLGRCAVVTDREDGWMCGTGSLRVRLDGEQVDPNFVALFIRHTGAADELVLKSVGSTMDNLNTEILGDLPVVVPPLREQADIVKHLESDLCEGAELTVALRDSIFLLADRRTALITAAVTGRIAVPASSAEYSGEPSSVSAQSSGGI